MFHSVTGDHFLREMLDGRRYGFVVVCGLFFVTGVSQAFHHRAEEFPVSEVHIHDAFEFCDIAVVQHHAVDVVVSQTVLVLGYVVLVEPFESHEKSAHIFYTQRLQNDVRQTSLQRDKGN